MNLTLAELMLERSPSHLKNLVDPRWTRVGLGIAQNNKQLYFLTQVFASRDLQLYPLTESELGQIQNNIVKFILSKYKSLNGENTKLSQDLNTYQGLKNQPDLIPYVNQLGYNGVGAVSS